MDPKPDLDAPEPGTVCETCGEPLLLTDFCGACAESMNPRTFEGFLNYALRSTVNGGSGRWPR